MNAAGAPSQCCSNATSSLSRMVTARESHVEDHEIAGDHVASPAVHADVKAWMAQTGKRRPFGVHIDARMKILSQLICANRYKHELPQRVPEHKIEQIIGIAVSGPVGDLHGYSPEILIEKIALAPADVVAWLPSSCELKEGRRAAFWCHGYYRNKGGEEPHS